MKWQQVQESWRERRRPGRPARDPAVHLEAALRWLVAAQDAPPDRDGRAGSPDRGVSHSYLIGDRWMRSYPETTGYIIPTFLNWSRLSGDADFARRALEMADWELRIQRADGAVVELTSGSPTVFDTGQVMFGWIAAYEHSGREVYLDAARRGAQWLLDTLDDDGVWRHASDAGGPGRVYNARVAWAVLELARITGDGRLEPAMRRFLDWGLEQERGEGWFDRNCLTDDRAPLLHTIAYTARGQWESHRLLGEARYLESSRRTCEAVAALVPADGRLPGRFTRDWRPAVEWVCLTGLAQMSILWRKHAALDLQGDGTARERAARFERAAAAVNGFLMRTQDLESDHPGLRGGIRGSFPASGAYGRWRVLNWATKFFADALMIERDPHALHHRG